MMKSRNDRNIVAETFKTDDDGDQLDSFDSHSSALQDSIITEEIDSQEESKSIKDDETEQKVQKAPEVKTTLKEQKNVNIKVMPKKKLKISEPKRMKVDLMFSKKPSMNYANYKNEGSTYSNLIKKNSTNIFS